VILDSRIAPGVEFCTLAPSLAATVVVPWTRSVAVADSYSGAGERGTCEWAVPSGCANSTRRVLYCHGGGYTSCTPAEYRGMSSRLAAAVGAPVFIFDYRKAPEFAYPAAIDDACCAMRFVADNGPTTTVPATEIIVMGDSAGGGMALGLLLRLQSLAASGTPKPHGKRSQGHNNHHHHFEGSWIFLVALQVPLCVHTC
jgi:acetyl esterase/lipase